MNNLKLHAHHIISLIMTYHDLNRSVGVFAALISVCGCTKKNFRHLEKSHLLLLCSIVYNIIRCSLCDLRRDLLYFYLLTYKSQSYGMIHLMHFSYDY